MAERNKAKKQRTIVQKYKFWRNWNVGLTAAKFAMPLVPFGTVLGLNWNEWVGNNASEGWSIGIGFGMLIVASLSAIIGIWKKDEIAKSKVSGILYVAIIFLVIGFGFKLLASIMNEIGNMFLYVSAGIAGSFAIDQVDKSVVASKAAFYKDLIEQNGLSKASAQRMEDIEQAKKEGEQAKKGKVDLL